MMLAHAGLVSSLQRAAETALRAGLWRYAEL